MTNLGICASLLALTLGCGGCAPPAGSCKTTAQVAGDDGLTTITTVHLPGGGQQAHGGDYAPQTPICRSQLVEQERKRQEDERWFQESRIRMTNFFRSQSPQTQVQMRIRNGELPASCAYTWQLCYMNSQ